MGQETVAAVSDDLAQTLVAQSKKKPGRACPPKVASCLCCAYSGPGRDSETRCIAAYVDSPLGLRTLQ